MKRFSFIILVLTLGAVVFAQGDVPAHHTAPPQKTDSLRPILAGEHFGWLIVYHRQLVAANSRVASGICGSSSNRAVADWYQRTSWHRVAYRDAWAVVRGYRYDGAVEQQPALINGISHCYRAGRAVGETGCLYIIYL